MSTPATRADDSDPGLDAAVRDMLLLMPRVVGRVKRIPIPEEFQSLSLAPRHLSLLAYLLFDGPMGIKDLAERLEVAPTTVSLMVAELSRKGVVERREDDEDRRRKIVSIPEAHRGTINDWLGHGAAAWRRALQPLNAEQRRLVVDTLSAYERSFGEDQPPG